MKSLSLYQPYAQLVAVRAKRVETRSWKTDYRGDIAICSSKSKIAQHFADVPFKPYIRKTDCRYGFVLCVAELFDIQRTESFLSKILGTDEVRFGNYHPYRWAWLLRNIRPLKMPLPIKGTQGLRALPPDIEAQILAAL